jgi:GlpG protein
MSALMKTSSKVTYSLMVLCLIVAMWTNLGHSPKINDFLIINPLELSGVSIWKRQFWRLITPIFLHFGWIHLIFNVTNLHAFGLMIEARKGSLFLLVMVVFIACTSNVAQLYWSHSFLFGGMSGVLYGLFGYVWIKGRRDPLFCDVRLSPGLVAMMMGWLVACWTGFLGPIANTAHLAGLVMGVVLAFLC